MKYYAILSYDPFIFLTAKSNDDPLEILREDYSFIKEEGLYEITEEFKPLTLAELYSALDKYMADKGLRNIRIQSVGAEEYVRTYGRVDHYYANNLFVTYPTYADTETIKDYAKHHPDEFKLALENALDLSLKNYMDSGMGSTDTSLDSVAKSDEDVIGYVVIPIRVIKTPILSFQETRE